jgi:hypothetical protein
MIGQLCRRLHRGLTRAPEPPTAAAPGGADEPRPAWAVAERAAREVAALYAGQDPAVAVAAYWRARRADGVPDDWAAPDLPPTLGAPLLDPRKATAGLSSADVWKPGAA